MDEFRQLVPVIHVIQATPMSKLLLFLALLVAGRLQAQSPDRPADPVQLARAELQKLGTRADILLNSA